MLSRRATEKSDMFVLPLSPLSYIEQELMEKFSFILVVFLKQLLNKI
jgi:hypothetical protein